MRSNKVLSNQQISWPDKVQTRLSYQMIFQEEVNPELDENIDLAAHLSKRDEKWKNKLKFEREKVYKQAFEAGKAEGLQKAREEIDAKLQSIKAAIDQGHKEWKSRQQIVDPGLLDLAFEISEEILGIPIENEKIRQKLEKQLIPIFRKLDDQSKPFIKVCESDLEFVQDLKEQYAGKMTVHITSSENCNPGEFEIETNEEIIVHKFQEILKEFKTNLTLPSWK